MKMKLTKEAEELMGNVVYEELDTPSVRDTINPCIIGTVSLYGETAKVKVKKQYLGTERFEQELNYQMFKKARDLVRNNLYAKYDDPDWVDHYREYV
jgi:hypothetical protein